MQAIVISALIMLTPIPKQEVNIYTCNVKDTSFKQYESYTALSKQSPQYQMLMGMNLQEGIFITNDNCYAVALASKYGNMGTKYKVTLDTGATFKVVKVDEKADIHTINQCHNPNGAHIEFIVNVIQMNKTIKKMGDYNYDNRFKGNITSMVKI